MEIAIKKLVNNNIVFVDGLTRVGKSMMNMLLASLKDMTHPQFIVPLEQMLPMYSTGEISKSAIKQLTIFWLNENSYNYNLSRNLNFRVEDLTSIYNGNNEKILLENLKKKKKRE